MRGAVSSAGARRQAMNNAASRSREDSAIAYEAAWGYEYTSKLASCLSPNIGGMNGATLTAAVGARSCP